MMRAALAFLVVVLAASEARADIMSFVGVWQVERRARPPLTEPPAHSPAGSGAGLPAHLATKLDTGDRRVFRQMTPAGQAMFATFDARLLPANNCESPGLPSIAMTPNLQAWTLGDGKLSIHHEYFDARREVLLGRAPSPLPSHTAAGQAIGRLDGGRLQIETTGLLPTWGGLARNAPSSDARVVRETYWPDGPDRLRGEIVIEDPKFLTGPIRLPVALRRAPPGTQIVTFPCDVEASRRHLDDGSN